jgi:hypothetical protein
MAGGWDMRAFHDPKAAPVAEISVSSSSALDEFLPKLAEIAGLGGYLGKKSSGGRFKYENGEIHIFREQN